MRMIAITVHYVCDVSQCPDDYLSPKQNFVDQKWVLNNPSTFIQYLNDYICSNEVHNTDLRCNKPIFWKDSI